MQALSKRAVIKHVTDGQEFYWVLLEIQDMNLIIPFKIHYFINMNQRW